MRLSDLKNETRKIQVHVGEEVAEVEYHVHAITPTLLSELKSLDDLDGIVHQVAQVVKRWDVLDDDGQEIPATREAILKYGIPLGFLTAVLNAITDDLHVEGEAKNA